MRNSKRFRDILKNSRETSNEIEKKCQKNCDDFEKFFLICQENLKNFPKLATHKIHSKKSQNFEKSSKIRKKVDQNWKNFKKLLFTKNVSQWLTMLII